MSSNHPTTDTKPEPIQSTSFGEFSPPDSLTATSPSEFVRMAGEAVRGSWIIPPELFNELPKRLAEIAMGDNIRSATKAAKLLLEMNGQNDPSPENNHYGGVVVYLPDNGRGGVM